MSMVAAVAAHELPDESRVWLARAAALAYGDAAERSGDVIKGRWGLGQAALARCEWELGEPFALASELWIAGNVRLDGRSALRARLRAPEAASDPELALRAYVAWGERCVEHLRGDFGFAIWDGRSGRLFCARDQLGVGQLHYARVGQQLLVSTALASLLRHPAVSDDLDELFIGDFLVLGYASGPAATAFSGIRRVPPAHVLRWSAGDSEIRSYWSIPEREPLLRLRPDEYAERFSALLADAVRDRLAGDRAAVQLSGGMDSSSVAVTLLDEFTGRGIGADALRAFTASLGGDSDDREGELALAIARSLRIPAVVVDASTLPAADPLAPPLPLTPEPYAYRWNSLSYDLTRLGAEHAPLMFTGLGGDPLFRFSPHYWLVWLTGGRIADVRRSFTDQLRLLGRHPRLRARGIARRARNRIVEQYRPVLTTPPWLDHEFVARTELTPRLSAARRFWLRFPDARSLAHDPLWAASFASADPTFTRLPVRFVHPLADLRLLMFVRRVAPDPWLADKYVLRQAMHGRLPAEILERPKTPAVMVRRPGTEADAVRRVIPLVADCPLADRFLDRAGIGAALNRFAESGQYQGTYRLALSLGLIQWLSHWRRPG